MTFTMKKLTASTLVAFAALLVFSAGCSQNREKELNAELASTQAALSKAQAELADARKAREEAEGQLNQAKAQD